MGLAIVALLVKGPHETGWFGWSGGWKMRAVPRKVTNPQTEPNRESGRTDVDAAAAVPPEDTPEAPGREPDNDEKGSSGGDRRAGDKPG